MLLAIDPGISTGWACYGPEGLVACGAPDLPASGVRPDVVIIEKPQAYRGSPVDPNNLITLAVRVGEYAERYRAAGAQVVLVLPREWKDQVTKVAHHPRIWAALSAREQDIVRQAGTGLGKKAVADLMDAVGLGQWATKKGIGNVSR